MTSTEDCDPVVAEGGAIDSDSLNFAQRHGDGLSSQGISLLGVCGFVVVWGTITLLKIHSIEDVSIAFLFFTGLPMGAASIIWNGTHRRSSTGLAGKSNATNWRRTCTKWLGLFGTIGSLGMFYFLIPEYSRSFYRPAWDICRVAVLPVLFVAVPYIAWIDRRMKEPEDGYFQAGLVFLGKWSAVRCNELRLYALGWLVKGFFLPFMLAGVADRLIVLNREGVNISSFGYLYSSGLNLIYTIDVVFGALGYLMTLRVLDAHIQSVESTVLGWFSTICCYVPFSTLVWTYILTYKGKTNWYEWLANYPTLCISWGFLIMLLHVVYIWSTCSFGCRFSNLTNRGIVTHGPYRYLRHPAYLSKNLAWWMMSVPFVAHHGWFDNSRACICLLITNVIYAIRAATEERHLLKDPAYQAYYAWIDAHGVFAHIKSLWYKPTLA
jgi:protein-S-isoprenylcysteine O-methyltransferase Ste14